MNDSPGLGAYLILVVLISAVAMFGHDVYTCVQYNNGFDCQEYDEGAKKGYDNHNETIYNKCVEYKSDHFDTKGSKIIGEKDLYYFSCGYIKGYEKRIKDSKIEWLTEEMDNDTMRNPPPYEGGCSPVRLYPISYDGTPIKNIEIGVYNDTFHKTYISDKTCVIVTDIRHGSRYNVTFGTHDESIRFYENEYYLTL